ncbi:MAG: DPP IV N-terminal domain-containing protein [Bacteroides sp.]|nr:DPP IV N-terminal domain-containing protein [Bacteroides sp.]
MAQQQLLTLYDLIPGGETYHRYLPENLYGLQWWEDKCIIPGMDSVCTVTPATGVEEVIVLREEVNNRLTARRLGSLPHCYDIRFSPSGKDEFYFKVTRRDTLHHVFYNFLRKEIVKVISSGRSYAELAPSGEAVAYTFSGTLWYSTEGVSDVIVAEGAEGVVNGEPVHRNEFGINTGIFWSPQDNKLAFYRMDESMVTEYPLVDISTRIASLQHIRYPMAGMTSHQVSVGIHDLENNWTIYLETGDPTDRYFTNIAWSPDEQYIYLVELNRGQDHAKLCRYEAGSDKLDRILLEEIHEKYVEPQYPVTFLPWDNDLFIYQSQQDGYNHLYLYDTEGKLIRQLTRGEWIVKNLVGFDEKKKEILYTSTEQSPLQENLFRISVKGEEAG